MLTYEEVNTVREDPYKWARQEKEKGRIVFGIPPANFPEELLHAAGIEPVLLQGSNEPATYGYSMCYHFMCGFNRSNIDWTMLGNLDFFDGFAYAHMCSQSYRMFQTMKYLKPKVPFLFMQWPLEASDIFVSTCVDRLKELQKKVEAFLGRKIDEGSLRESIALYNRYRGLMRKIYEMRKQNPWIMRAREMSALVQAGTVIPKKDYVEFLERFIPELEKREPAMDDRVKIYLSGHLCYPVKVDLLDLVEEIGGVVAWDDMDTGFRYVASDAPTDLPPIEAFADRYINLVVPSPSRTEIKNEWADYVVRMVKESDSQGIIILIAKQCGPHLLYHSFMKDVLDDAGLAHLDLEVEHEIVSMEGLRTRVEAFVEMLRERR